MTNAHTRRTFIATAGAALATPMLAKGQPGLRQRALEQGNGAFAPPGPVAISSGNGLETVRLAHNLLRQGADPLDAIVEGVRIVEDDPNDQTVGLGGLPNEEGIVELDASVMHGPMHRSGAVASLRNIKNPAAVAREVARRTDHCLLVGEGALKFALRMGFQEENLLTEASRKAWLRWRATLNRDDDWLEEDEFDLPKQADEQKNAQRDADDAIRAARSVSPPIDFTYGTIHCSALTQHGGDLAGCTTTSGLSWKLPGRVGDSPIIGAGCYTDNAVGSAGATGRGEAVIQICGAHVIVMRMESGDHPTDACLYALKKIADRTKPARLLDDQGRPNFNVVFYAVRKDGAYGSACMRKGAKFAIADANGARLEECAHLYE